MWRSFLGHPVGVTGWLKAKSLLLQQLLPDTVCIENSCQNVDMLLGIPCRCGRLAQRKKSAAFLATSRHRVYRKFLTVQNIIIDHRQGSPNLIAKSSCYCYTIFFSFTLKTFRAELTWPNKVFLVFLISIFFRERSLKYSRSRSI